MGKRFKGSTRRLVTGSVFFCSFILKHVYMLLRVYPSTMVA